MDGKGFQVWLSAVRRLTRAQRREALAVLSGRSHEALNHSMGERVRGDLHVQTVNSRHSRLKDFLRPRRGIATRYLDNYLSWFHLVGLAPGANDRACLAAAVTR